MATLSAAEDARRSASPPPRLQIREATQRGIVAPSSAAGGASRHGIEQLQDVGDCRGSHGPVAFAPAPRERRSCQPRPYDTVLRTSTGTSIP
mmetsp:Transcript_19235/g.57395  ORF Transcript_19235/g.57395 Transcript_19235/m.57395 type:complete len:92 (+) Transcript_19235:1183-1458(+)